MPAHAHASDQAPLRIQLPEPCMGFGRRVLQMAALAQDGGLANVARQKRSPGTRGSGGTRYSLARRDSVVDPGEGHAERVGTRKTSRVGG